VTRRVEPVLGVDLGTTFCSMALCDPTGDCRIIPNADGRQTTPTALYFFDQDQCVLGEEAVRMSVLEPSQTVRYFKRHLGDPDFRVRFFGHDYSPQELTALVLRRLVADAEEALGEPIERIVLTVPASFNSAQRGAAIEAAELAGLDVLSLLNEPTAAAVAHQEGKDPAGTRTLLVFDLGGGTLDATVMITDPEAHQIIATTGQVELGGKEWDERIVAHVAEIAFQERGIDPRDDPHSYHDLYERSVAAKIRLSVEDTARVALRVGNEPLVVDITRKQFEELCTDLLSRCEDTAREAISLAHLEPTQLDEVLLVGGSTHMPMIRALLRRVFGDSVQSAEAPETLVAKGAALAGKLLAEPRASDQAPPTRRIVDVTSHDLGLVVLDANLVEQILLLIPASTTVPHETRGRFATAYDGMTAVQVEVTEGKGVQRSQVAVIGTLVMDNLPPRPRGTPIDVVYRYNASQVLEIDLVDVETGQCRALHLQLAGALDPQERAEAIRSVHQTEVS